jgi:hypothetical protein
MYTVSDNIEMLATSFLAVGARRPRERAGEPRRDTTFVMHAAGGQWRSFSRRSS